MMVHRKILAIVGCTECGAPVSPVNENELVCTECHTRFPVKEGVPFMIPARDQAEDVAAHKAGSKPQDERPSDSIIHRLYKVFSPPTAVLVSDKGKITRFLSSLEEGACVVDIGSGVKRRAENVINLDIGPFPNVDLVFDGGDLPIRDGTVDGVISTAVLEHIPDATRYVSELYRILKGGGKFLITVPFMMGFHSSPSDYRRYTTVGLEALFSRFEKVEFGIECGPSSALAWVLQEWIAIFGNNSKTYHLLKLVAGWLVQPIKYFDLLLTRKPYASKIAAGYYYVGRKDPASKGS
jgi:SAM-dependent methyltransferase